MQRHDLRPDFRHWMGTAFLLIAGSLACVTQGSYDEALADRERLSSRVEILESANAEIGNELTALRARSVEIEEELRTEISAGLVLISEIQDGIRVGMSNQLLFASGSAILSKKGRDVILRLAKQLRKGDEMISVEGHTDNVMIGAALESQYPSNWELAGARAARVARRLSAEGVDPRRLKVVSYGPFAPTTSNDTEEGRSRNRRTEILLRPASR